MPNKIDLVQGAYQLIKISGLTVEATPSEINMGVQVADDLAGELSSTLSLGYIQPLEYGNSDPNDYSGLTAQTAGPFKKLLAKELAASFGKELPTSLVMNARAGMRSLEQLLVNVAPSQNPSTLPIGSGNEYAYQSNKFYPEPVSDDGGIYKNTSDIFQLPIDWTAWLAGLYDLSTVLYTADSGIVLTDEEIEDSISLVTVSFSKQGQFTLCAKATNSNGDTTTERVVYNVSDCNSIYP